MLRRKKARINNAKQTGGQFPLGKCPWGADISLMRKYHEI
jgi:hypothetical protein